MQEALEVSFSSGDTRRRRESLVTNKFGRPAAFRQATSCFVHSLLEQQRNRSHHEPNKEADEQANPADKAHETPAHNGHQTESRLLTKRQLADMAFGIRELSKKLGHVRLHLVVRNVFLLTKAHDQELIAKTRELACCLLDRKNSKGEAYVV